jgi:hypothetical protein
MLSTAAPGTIGRRARSSPLGREVGNTASSARSFDAGWGSAVVWGKIGPGDPLEGIDGPHTAQFLMREWASRLMCHAMEPKILHGRNA